MERLKAFAAKYRIVERHKNPIGIFLRIPVYLLIFWALWVHNYLYIAIGLLFEFGLWFLVPPVQKSFNFIEEIVATEIAWLKAKTSPIKILSILLLIAALALISIGLWIHSWKIIIISLSLLIVFNLLMNKIGRQASDKL